MSNGRTDEAAHVFHAVKAVSALFYWKKHKTNSILVQFTCPLNYCWRRYCGFHILTHILEIYCKGREAISRILPLECQLKCILLFFALALNILAFEVLHSRGIFVSGAVSEVMLKIFRALPAVKRRLFLSSILKMESYQLSGLLLNIPCW